MRDNSAAVYYSEGRQTNPGANTILANTGTLTTGGILGANYKVVILLNGSAAMTYKLEALNESSVVVTTIYLSAPANDAKFINMDTSFFIPNGYSLRIRNDAAILLGGTLQASIILKISNLVDI